MTTTETVAFRAKRVTWIAVLALLPIAAVIAGTFILVTRQRAAAAEFERLVGAAGDADTLMAQRFAERTSKEGTAAWSKISALCVYSAWGNVDNLPILGEGDIPDDFASDNAWPQEDLVQDYLSEMRPVIDLIHASTDVRKPVWQPMEFDGLNTLLPEVQNSRSIARLLQLEALFSIHLGDAERAMAAMRSMRATVEVYDWHMFLVGELVSTALERMLQDTVGMSLQAKLWSSEQLDVLDSLVKQPIPVAEKWRSAFEAEELWITSSIDKYLPISAGVSASEKLQWFQNYQKIKLLADYPVGELSKRAAEWDLSAAGLDETRSAGELTLNDLGVSTAMAAKAFENLEYHRRLVYTAVGIKRYQLMNDRWPDSLADLREVGLSDADWSLPERGFFGYESTEDAAIIYNYASVQEYNLALPNTIKRLPDASYDEIIIR